MSDAVAALILAAVAAFFMWCGYGQAKARLTGRAHPSAARIGNERPGSYAAALVWFLLALLFAGGAIVRVEQAIAS